MESIIRENGATPATIGIIEGKVFVGLQQSQLEYLAQKGLTFGSENTLA